jgi:hypothetical protein
MYNSRRISGFAVAFLMLTAVSAAALKQKSVGVRPLNLDEAAMIRGGLSLPSSGTGIGGGSLSPTSGGSGSSAVNISLNNVPYVSQFTYDTRGTRESGSVYYCGIASALMVRAKLSKENSSAPPIYNTVQGTNYSHVDKDMRTIDTNLQNGRYGISSRQVDVLVNHGLLYIGYGTDAEQYWSTVEILSGVYRGKLRGRDSDGVFNDNRHVSDASMGLVSVSEDIFATKKLSEATKAIWDHINNYRQPVVVVVDSNKQDSGGTIRNSSGTLTLHYIVIRGIKETSGIRYFLVYDPGNDFTKIEYTENQLMYLMGMYGAPEWVYRYGRDTIVPRGDMPAYMLTVQGD